MTSHDTKLNRLDKKFYDLKTRGEKGLITYVTAGFPDLKTTVVLVEEMARAGADVVEIGIPFSDPVADGPTIQRASERALEGGVMVPDIIKAAAAARSRVDIPLVFMTYYNPVMQYGPAAFVKDAAEAGIDGLIIPDLPHEEAGELRELTRQHNLCLIPLVAPVTPEARLSRITGSCGEGFIYCVSVNGVTGARQEIKTDVEKFTRNVRKYTDLPLAVGFGISGPQQAALVAAHCDAVIVGSAIINIIAENSGSSRMIPSLQGMVQEIKAVLRT